MRFSVVQGGRLPAGAADPDIDPAPPAAEAVSSA